MDEARWRGADDRPARIRKQLCLCDARYRPATPGHPHAGGSGGTLVLADGRTQHLSATDIQLTPLDTWTSPTSKATYPSRWQVSIPSLGLALNLTPLLADQELRTTRSTQVTYWEGAVAVEGTERGQPIKGQGYVELTGYAERIKEKL